ncbi:hypothetical protein ASD83_12785 [Devosia sp. Root685]|uniref:reverse transcriptase family protein n=1 Tax=Devosia sp. Root685 TaxID=1736587 RepID=UPI0006FCC0AC|nr:reverse transcriptase family protein [Devosia sp. Root685]KRA97937.1 hypothetical protein ASD83_12785 [Devosia sp. Root685]
MTRWNPQQFKRDAERAGLDPAVTANAIRTARLVTSVDPDLPPVLTLRHLAALTRSDYLMMRGIAMRSQNEHYRLFRIRKKPAHDGEKRFRVIAVPEPGLMRAQRWIAQRILARIRPHGASVAFSKGDKLVEAARPHCGARWLIKLDVSNFFESINETAVYRVFRSLGYQPLVCMEMARLCTRLGTTTHYRSRPRWLLTRERSTIEVYSRRRMGHLPQGAPTSPMLANLAVRLFDEAIQELADANDLAFTRYADDIALSSQDAKFGRDRCAAVIGKVYAKMGEFGLSPNATKTRVASPGARKVVLGLLVDGDEPRLPRDFRANMRRHLHYLCVPGADIAVHAAARGFDSISGMKNHVFGLAMFARQIERDYGDECLSKLNAVAWPR